MPGPTIIRPLRPGESAACEAILRGLPDWFGIEEALVQYVRDLDTCEAFVAEADEAVIGLIALRQRSVAASEIHVMAIAPEHHRRGIGSALVAHVEDLLRARGVEYLQVKTLGPSRPDDYYARTRAFYESVGFRPLEENLLWGPANPCLIMVKHVRCRRREPA
jgi:predicted N-acetyltransferase YhbS